ncbi:MAG TPA: hypothetical protein VMX17_13935 [Candidatus Glassbacteria bacterium]|nr:hypothetical protein [Candidatus Glassbacteria bacterium]
MDKYKINLDNLGKQISAPKMIKHADVKDRLKKVAFDVVVFRDNPEKLWQIVDGDDGGQYIVAMYGDETPSISKSSAGEVENPWSVEVSCTKTSATIFYKDTPVSNVDLVKNAVSDVLEFKASVPKMLNGNKVLIAKMINDLDANYRKQIVSKYPELYNGDK